MKYCTHCGKELVDEAVVCTACGCATANGEPKAQTDHSISTKYCTHCGKEIAKEAVVCPGCGCATTRFVNDQFNTESLVNALSTKVKTNGIIWICIAGLQLLLGITINWVLLIVGVLNLVSGIQDINFSKAVVQKPIGIIKKFEPLTAPIIALVYNLIFGGVIGIAGSIYYLVAIRSFVMENKTAFAEIENGASVS